MDQPWPVHIDQTDTIHKRYSLRGRGTWVIKVRQTLVDDELVAKISWPEESRWNEAYIIEQARARGEGQPEILEHLPVIHSSVDIANTSTSQIRRFFGLADDGCQNSRVLRLLFSPRLSPITKLDPAPLWRNFWECFRCHYLTWGLGVHHRDVSANNIMCNKHGKGIMNDWDLATIKDMPCMPLNAERTGTMPFMALELLTDAGWNGRLEHRYRHDSESFAWVLMWTLARFKDGKEIPTPPLENWNSGDYEQCHNAKLAIGTACPSPPSSCSTEHWNAARTLVAYWITFRTTCSDNKIEEPVDQEVYSRVLQLKEPPNDFNTGIEEGFLDARRAVKRFSARLSAL
ncbi:hypothetical protein BOTBODRAFT_115622 [Botryobasidium botryosum FD-172 SS1]|uniref:Fungal-type protein kinase domain-containing protein n=1 Tax=Botryobasidium botryosum (strain FD-172 SS1) TaxID=930990 RepID=A0A067MF89_BOTB1|nr:hypothetical protein BOTBODRAFT_115622 [Botryobasidium botryosum FD-172 SS1]